MPESIDNPVSGLGVDCDLSLELVGEEETLAFGRQLAGSLRPGTSVHLIGDLGMGKTTLCKGILQGAGHPGHVKSPTYTLVEPYFFGDLTLNHFDLYRLSDPEELEYIGWRDYFAADAICLIEWPEKGAGLLPVPDIEIQIEAAGAGRRLSLKYSASRDS